MTARMNPEARRTLLLDQARAQFLEHGYERVRVEDIMAVSGISKGGFYHHFKSKDDILNLLVDHEVAGLAGEITIAGNAGALSALVALFELGSRYLNHPEGIGETLSSDSARTLYIRAIETSFDRHLKPVLCKLVEDGIDDGSFLPVDPTGTAELIIAVNNHINRRAILDGRPDTEIIAFSRTGIGLLGTHLGITDKLSSLLERFATIDQR